MTKTTKISIAKARAQLTDLVDRARLADEEFIITKSGKGCAKIVSLHASTPAPRIFNDPSPTHEALMAHALHNSGLIETKADGKCLSFKEERSSDEKND